MLLVEDNGDKLQKVASLINELRPTVDLETAHDAGQAKRLLRERHFDVLIIDILLPMSPGAQPDPKGGVHLLRSIVKGASYNKPTEIIGLSAHPHLVEEYGGDFSSTLWTLIPYDATSELWWEQIKSKIEYLQGIAARRPDGDYESELCVIDALYEPELRAVLSLPWEWTELRRDGDATLYWEGYFHRGEQRFRVIAASATRMGMPSAATLSMKMIEAFRPRYICMTGIAAGTKGMCSFGDVIAADPCWDYGVGKYVMDGDRYIFQAAPEQIPLDTFLKGRLRALSLRGQTLEDVRARWVGNPIANRLQLHIGPFASGAAVLADSIQVSRVREQQRKLVGIDMEAYAVFAAAHESTRPQPIPMVLKGVVDFADTNKGDEFRSYAAYTSAQVLRLIMEEASE